MLRTDFFWFFIIYQPRRNNKILLKRQLSYFKRLGVKKCYRDSFFFQPAIKRDDFVTKQIARLLDERSARPKWNWTRWFVTLRLKRTYICRYIDIHTHTHIYIRLVRWSVWYARNSDCNDRNVVPRLLWP